jgi:hypothetical protein
MKSSVNNEREEDTFWFTNNFVSSIWKVWKTKIYLFRESATES